MRSSCPSSVSVPVHVPRISWLCAADAVRRSAPVKTLLRRKRPRMSAVIGFSSAELARGIVELAQREVGQRNGRVVGEIVRRVVGNVVLRILRVVHLVRGVDDGAVDAAARSEDDAHAFHGTAEVRRRTGDGPGAINAVVRDLRRDGKAEVRRDVLDRCMYRPAGGDDAESMRPFLMRTEAPGTGVRPSIA